jgi:uncharacterized membrane protein
MPASAILLVLLAAVLHASWNAATKASADPMVTMAFISFSGGLYALPFLPAAAFPAREAWPYLAVSMVLHLGYQLFLINAYRFGDLSQVYPIARGLAPCLLAVLAAALANERLSPVAVAGLVIVSLSLSSLAFSRSGASGAAFETKALVLALTTSGFIASYTYVDAIGARLSQDVWGFIVWMHALDAVPMVLVVAFLRRHTLPTAIGDAWRRGLVGGGLAAVSYGLVLWVIAQNPMANVSTLRETSVLWAAILGWLYLGESFGVRRFAAAVGVVVGLIALQL